MRLIMMAPKAGGMFLQLLLLLLICFAWLGLTQEAPLNVVRTRREEKTHLHIYVCV
jgi:hypothetical protein